MLQNMVVAQLRTLFTGSDERQKHTKTQGSPPTTPSVGGVCPPSLTTDTCVCGCGTTSHKDRRKPSGMHFFAVAARKTYTRSQEWRCSDPSSQRQETRGATVFPGATNIPTRRNEGGNSLPECHQHPNGHVQTESVAAKGIDREARERVFDGHRPHQAA
jgi:hypothetical protein